MNITFLLGGIGFSFLILDLMKLFGVRQYGYLLEANKEFAFSGLGLYRIAIFLIIISFRLCDLFLFDLHCILLNLLFLSRFVIDF